MNILIANKFYYNRGGSDIYSIELEKLLQNKGHNVAFFAMNYPQNNKSIWQKYWISQFSIKTPFRPFGDKETERKFNKLLDDFKPDVVHLNIIHTHISPIIAEIAHRRKVNVVWTMHEYKLICPNYLCLNGNCEICEKCFGDNKKNCAKNRCIKNQWLHSFIAQKEAEKWNRERLEKCVDTFICPSNFMKQKMIQGGFSENKLHVLHNFVDIPEAYKSFSIENRESCDYYAYIGRLSREKGVETLCSVASKLPYKLKIIGTGPVENILKEKYKHYKQIEFLGYKNKENTLQIMANAKFTVCPSEWYEVFGLVIIESIAVGTPVLGANIGGIPELTDNLFESRNENDLRIKIENMRKNTEVSQHIYQNSEIIKKFSFDSYFEKLLKIYKLKKEYK